VLPHWAEWFSSELVSHRAIEPLIGLGCEPIVVNGTQKRFLAWIGHALKRGRISIPDGNDSAPWQAPAGFAETADERTDGGVAD
jgi:hypothetical protein